MIYGVIKMATEQRMCDPKCAAFKGGVCAVHLQSVEFATVNGVAKVVEICELPNDLVIGFNR